MKEERKLYVPWSVAPLSTLRLRIVETGEEVEAHALVPEGCDGLLFAFVSAEAALEFSPGMEIIEMEMGENIVH